MEIWGKQQSQSADRIQGCFVSQLYNAMHNYWIVFELLPPHLKAIDRSFGVELGETEKRVIRGMTVSDVHLFKIHNIHAWLKADPGSEALS